MTADEIIIAETRKWIADVVVGCNFCPFAGKVLKAGTIHYVVVAKAEVQTTLEQLSLCFLHLDATETIETLFLIFPGDYQDFDDYLNIVDLAEALLKKQKYEGTYQVASFHPHYVFEGSTDDDPANYTNRSPYPMLHLLREESVSKAIDGFPGVEQIPEHNVDYARKKGLLYLRTLREACFLK